MNGKNRKNPEKKLPVSEKPYMIKTVSDREAKLEAELKAAHIEIDLLKQKVDALARIIYRPKSDAAR